MWEPKLSGYPPLHPVVHTSLPSFPNDTEIGTNWCALGLWFDVWLTLPLAHHFKERCKEKRGGGEGEVVESRQGICTEHLAEEQIP